MELNLYNISETRVGMTTNIICKLAILGICISILYFVYDLWSGLYKFVLFQIVSIPAFLALIWLAYKQAHFAIKVASCFVFPTVIFVISIITNQYYSIDVLLLPTALYPYLLFKEKKYIKFFFFFSSSLFLIIQGIHIFNEQIINKSYALLFALCSLLTIFFLYILFEKFVNDTQTYINFIQKKHDGLAQLNNLLEKQLVTYTQELAEKSDNLERMVKDQYSYAYIISHDIKEPIRNIISFSQLIKRDIQRYKYDDLSEYTDFVIKSGFRLNQLMDDVLVFFTLREQPIIDNKVDIALVLKNVQRKLQAEIEKSNAQIDYQNMPVVRGNNSHFELIFAHLISNSIKFCNLSQNPHIRINAIEDNIFWYFAVEDNGIGIESAYHKHVFELFKRLQNDINQPDSGVGLAICKRIVELYNGDIWIEEKSSSGTLIKFSIKK